MTPDDIGSWTDIAPAALPDDVHYLPTPAVLGTGTTRYVFGPGHPSINWASVVFWSSDMADVTCPFCLVSPPVVR